MINQNVVMLKSKHKITLKRNNIIYLQCYNSDKMLRSCLDLVLEINVVKINESVDRSKSEKTNFNATLLLYCSGAPSLVGI